MYYLENFCRLCLSFNGNFHKIYNESIIKMITACLGDFIFYHNLPSFVCHDCLEKLDLFFSFKKRFLRSEYLMSLYVEKLYQSNSIRDFKNTDLRVNIMNNVSVSPINSYYEAQHLEIHRKNGLRKGKKPSFLRKITSIVFEESSKVDYTGDVFVESEFAFSDRNKNLLTNTLKRKSHVIELQAKKVKSMSNTISDPMEHTLTSHNNQINNKSIYDENLSVVHFHKVYKGPRNLKPILNEGDVQNVHFKNYEVSSQLKDLLTSENYVENIDDESELCNQNLTDVNIQLKDPLALPCSTSYNRNNLNSTQVYTNSNRYKKSAYSSKITKKNDLKKFYINEKKITHHFKIVYKDKSNDLTKSNTTLNVSDRIKKPTFKKTVTSKETIQNKYCDQSQKLTKSYCASSTCKSKQHKSNFVNIQKVYQGCKQLHQNVTPCIYTYDIPIPKSKLAITTNTDLEEQIAVHQIQQSNQVEKPKVQVRNLKSLKPLNENVAQKSDLKNTQLSNLKTTSVDQLIHEYVPTLQPVLSESILSRVKRQDPNLSMLSQKSNSTSDFRICGLYNNKEISSTKLSTTIRNEHSYSMENSIKSNTDNQIISASKTANKEVKTFVVLATPANTTQPGNLKEKINNTWSKYMLLKKIDLGSSKTVGNTPEAIKENNLVKSSQNTNASEISEQNKTSETSKGISLLKSAQSANSIRIPEPTVPAISKEEIIPEFSRTNTFPNFENEMNTIIKEEYNSDNLFINSEEIFNPFLPV